MEHTDRAKDLAQKCQDMIIEFTDRTKVNVDKYREFYQMLNKYYSSEVGENDSEIRMVIKTHDNLDVREQLFNKMALMNTPIIEMRYHEVSLEEIFLSLTKGGSNQNIRRKTLNKELKESVE